MKKINGIKIIIKFVLVCFAVGCTQETELPKPEGHLAPFTVKDARMWFEANLEPMLHAHTQAIAKSGETGLPSLIPFFDWSRAITGFNEDWSVVELPWEYKNGKVVFSIDGAGSNEPDFASDSLQLLRLVMAKNLNTNDVYAFKMVVLPDPKYLEQGGNLPENQYLQMQSDFRGLVLFYNVLGKFVVGYEYKEGRIVYKLVSDPEPDTKSGESARLKDWGWVAVTTCWYRDLISASGDLIGTMFLGCDPWRYYYIYEPGTGDVGGVGGGFSGCPICGPTCFCSGGGGGGGGYGGTPPEHSQMMPRVNNPCEKVRFLGNSDMFRSKMAKLIGYTNKNFEAGYLLRNNHDGTFSYEYMRGPEGTFEIGIECCPQRQILGLIHSHPVGGLPIFSVYDIQAIYKAYRDNCIENLGFFPIGVVTPQGTYLLVVSDVRKFLAFGTRFLKDPVWFLFAQGAFEEHFLIHRDPEKAFLKFLKQFNAGLMLFEGNHTDFDQWLNLKLDQEGNPVVNPNPC